MNATYHNEFNEEEECTILSCPINNFTLVLIEFEDGERGYCSNDLLTED